MGDRKQRSYLFRINDRQFVVARYRVKDIMPAWEGRGNPWLWFSWETFADGDRDYIACGVKTMREAQWPIDQICGITG